MSNQQKSKRPPLFGVADLNHFFSKERNKDCETFLQIYRTASWASRYTHSGWLVTFAYYTLFIVICSLFISCFNPFSPRIDNSTSTENIITDQKTIEGLFQNFKYAYTFKDTTIYGQLLTEDFVFTYFDYDLGVDVSWDRPTDMKTTEGLFANTQDLKLIWNNIVFQEGDSVEVDVKRSFNLAITFNPNDVINFNGFVDMTLVRPGANDKWHIRRWRDLTNP